MLNTAWIPSAIATTLIQPLFMGRQLGEERSIYLVYAAYITIYGKLTVTGLGLLLRDITSTVQIKADIRNIF